MGLEYGSLDDLKNFLGSLGKSPILEYFNFLSLQLKERLLCFPSVSVPTGIDMRDEEEYVWVEMSPNDSLALEGNE